MNILITGANGFLGREFERLFDNTEHTLFITNRNNLDVAKKNEVDIFFKNNKIDFVLHTAFAGVGTSTEDSEKMLTSNLEMYKNLASHSSDYKLMISFGSGAAFDRKKDIDGILESELADRNPSDFYGMAKNSIARDIIKHNGNIVNLRLFGCFGPLEDPKRLIKNSINRVLKNKPIIIYKDKKMDFFYVDDLYKVIMFYIKNYNESLPRDVNMSYQHKMMLSDIGNKIKNLTNNNIDVIIDSESVDMPYTGNSSLLQKFELDLKGPNLGIEEVCCFYGK